MSPSTQNQDFVYKVHRVSPTAPSFPLLCEKFSALRLRALLTSPTSFSSTHALESTFTPSQWQTRLSRPRVHTFVAVAYPANSADDMRIEDGEWVGKVTLLGPMPRDVYEIKESGGPKLGDEGTETLWQMTALYSEPSHRGKGLANQIITAAIEFARGYDAHQSTDGSLTNGVTPSQASAFKGKSTRARIMIHPDNAVVVSLYQKLGFVDAGKCTLAEAFISNGDRNLLPEDGGASAPEKYGVRRGLVMEVVKEAL